MNNDPYAGQRPIPSALPDWQDNYPNDTPEQFQQRFRTVVERLNQIVNQPNSQPPPPPPQTPLTRIATIVHQTLDYLWTDELDIDVIRTRLYSILAITTQ